MGCVVMCSVAAGYTAHHHTSHSQCLRSAAGAEESTGRRHTTMLDLAFIRSHPDIVKEAARVKNNTLDIDYLLEVDRQVLALQRQVEDARAQQNQISRRVQQAGKDKVQRDALIAEGKQLAEQIKAMEPQLNEL